MKIWRTILPRFNTKQELQNFIVNCDENLQVNPGLLTDTAIWYRNWYFAQIFDTKVDFYRVYFDEMKKEAYKTKVFTEDIENISESLIKHLCRIYEDNMEFVLKRIKETKAAQMLDQIRSDFD